MNNIYENRLLSNNIKNKQMAIEGFMRHIKQILHVIIPATPCFHAAQDDIGKNNKMFHKLQLSNKNISTYTLLKFWILAWSKSKFQAIFFCFSPYPAVQKETKRCCKGIHTNVRTTLCQLSITEKRAVL